MNASTTMNATVTETVILRIILPIMCSLGILGIIVTLIVLSQKPLRSSTNCHLMALASTDLMFLVILSTHLADNQFVPLSNPYYHFSIYVTYSGIFLQIFLLASVWLTVMLAVGRFIAICKPFLAKSLCTVNKAMVTICIIYLIAIICRCPNFWENQIQTVTLNNSTVTYIEGSALSTNHHYIVWYPWIVDGALTSMIPFLLLLILNIRLILEVRSSSRYLQHQIFPVASEAVHREERQITIMLISVIVVFFICQAPYVIYTAVLSINKFVLYSPYLLVFRHITVMMLALKSSINFIIYCWFSERFFASLKKLFSRTKSFRRSSARSSTRVTSFKRGCEFQMKRVNETFV